MSLQDYIAETERLRGAPPVADSMGVAAVLSDLDSLEVIDFTGRLDEWTLPWAKKKRPPVKFRSRSELKATIDVGESHYVLRRVMGNGVLRAGFVPVWCVDTKDGVPVKGEFAKIEDAVEACVEANSK